MSQDEALATTAGVDRRAKGHHETLSRRALIAGGGASLASMLGTARRAAAREGPPEVSADVDPGSVLAKLVRRTSMGINEVELNRANTLGYAGYLEYQLDHLAIDDSALDAMLATLPTLGDLEAYEFFNHDPSQLISEISQAINLRAIFSNRQLFERMVEFWTDHFNINMAVEYVWHLKPWDDREVIRANALGTFPELLSASAHSAAMLHYLDNIVNVADNRNENYARELMELHTMGVDGGYTQTDVIEVARCFTGWTEYGWGTGVNQGLFRYRAADHDNGQKIVLGNIIPAGGGMQDGLTVLDILVDHPSTARFISTKLCKRLLSENPPRSVIDSVVAAYVATRGDIKAMIRAALEPNVLADAALKYKRPFHLIASALRTLPKTINTTTSLRDPLEQAGHRPYFWTAPDGYPDTFAHWSGLILPRWNFGFSLVAGQIPGISVDYAALFAGLTTADQMAERINQVMFLGEMPSYDRDRIRDVLLPDPPSAMRQRDAIGLAIVSPSFQWY